MFLELSRRVTVNVAYGVAYSTQVTFITLCMTTLRFTLRLSSYYTSISSHIWSHSVHSVHSDTQSSQDTEFEIVFPELFPDTSPPPPDKPNIREADANAGSSSREVRSISNWESYESHDLHRQERPGLQTKADSGLRLKLSAFGKDLELILNQDTRFLSQKFMVEKRPKARKASQRSPPAFSSANAEAACYYSGTVLNYAGSIATFSTCAGLVNTSFPIVNFLFVSRMYVKSRICQFNQTIC